MIPVSTTRGDRIHYAEEISLDGGLTFEQRTVDVVQQDWDVTDPQERAAREGDVTEHAQWFVRPEDNAAVLVVFRP